MREEEEKTMIEEGEAGRKGGRGEGGGREEGRKGGRGREEGGRGGILQSPGHRAYLNVIDWVNVLHRVLHHLTHLLQPSVGPQGGHSAPLHQHIALRQQLHCL